jgi:hypothetical protein
MQSVQHSPCGAYERIVDVPMFTKVVVEDFSKQGVQDGVDDDVRGVEEGLCGVEMRRVHKQSKPSTHHHSAEGRNSLVTYIRRLSMDANCVYIRLTEVLIGQRGLNVRRERHVAGGPALRTTLRQRRINKKKGKTYKRDGNISEGEVPCPFDILRCKFRVHRVDPDEIQLGQHISALRKDRAKSCPTIKASRRSQGS